jgi:hypothetical protein
VIILVSILIIVALIALITALRTYEERAAARKFEEEKQRANERKDDQT